MFALSNMHAYTLMIPKLPYCETASLFSIHHLARKMTIGVAIAEACDAFNRMLLQFGCTQNLELYDPRTHQVNPLQTNPFG